MVKNRMLVTGCAGFIGGHMLERLVAEGHDVVGVDDFSTGKHENLAATAGRFHLIEGDLCDPAVSSQAVRGVSHVFHFASIPSVPRSVADPLENMRSSVTATVTLLIAAAGAGVKRVVQSVSSACYGNNPVLPKVETMLPEPLSPYAAAKLAQEYYGQAFSASLGLDTAALRYFNVFGPRQDPKSEYAAVIPKFITMMLGGKRPTIFGDGTQSRDFIYVSNVVDANLVAVFHPEPLGGSVFNIACGERIDLNRLVERLNLALGTDLPPIHSQPRAGDVLHSLADVGKAEQVLGYRPAVDFDEGLRRTVSSFRR